MRKFGWYEELWRSSMWGGRECEQYLELCNVSFFNKLWIRDFA